MFSKAYTYICKSGDWKNIKFIYITKSPMREKGITLRTWVERGKEESKMSKEKRRFALTHDDIMSWSDKCDQTSSGLNKECKNVACRVTSGGQQHKLWKRFVLELGVPGVHTAGADTGTMHRDRHFCYNNTSQTSADHLATPPLRFLNLKNRTIIVISLVFVQNQWDNTWLGIVWMPSTNVV